MVKKNLSIAIVAAAFSGPLYAQEIDIDSSLELVGNRQCAIEGSDLYVFLQERLPECSRFCSVDKEYYTRSKTFSGRVFACSDRDFATLPIGEGVSGLSGRDTAIGLIGLGLLLGVASGGSDGATSDTQ